jgi:DNA-binding transcriptional ArsR family regulator
MAKILGHPIRQRVLFEYGERDTSPSKVARALGIRVNVASYHTQVLARTGLIELVGERRIRGATEHVYHAVAGRDIADGVWASLPWKLRRSLTRLLTDGMWKDVKGAIVAGSFDAASAHLSRSYYVLDDEALAELAELLLRTLEEAVAIQARAELRQHRPGRRIELLMLGFDEPTVP